MHTGFEDKVPLSVQFGTSSLGTGGGKNPSFRIFEHDAETMLPVEIHRHYMNLTKSNEDKVAQWGYLYATKEEYNLPDFSPQTLFDFTSSWEEGNVDMLKKTIVNADGRYARQSTDQVSCDDACIKNAQCNWRSSESYEMKDCKGQDHLDFFNHLDDSLFELMNDPWVEGSGF